MSQTNQSGVAYCQFVYRVEPVQKTLVNYIPEKSQGQLCLRFSPCLPATNPTCKQSFLVTKNQPFDIVTLYFDACGN